MARSEAPSYFPWRLLIFNQDGTFTLRSFDDFVVCARVARELPDDVRALVCSVHSAINGGDYPSGVAEPPQKSRPKPLKWRR